MRERAIAVYENYMMGKTDIFRLHTDAERSSPDRSSKSDNNTEYKKISSEDDDRKRQKILSTEKMAKHIGRYVIENILHWTPEEAMQHMTPATARKCGLDKVFKYLKYRAPREIDDRYDLGYYITVLYPGLNYDMRQQVVDVYDRIRRGEVSAFPKRMFQGVYGRRRAALILGEFIKNNFADLGVTDLYRTFTDTKYMNELMKRENIYYICNSIYGLPIEWLHDALPEDQRNDFLFYFYDYKLAFNEAKKQLDIEKRIVKKAKKLLLGQLECNKRAFLPVLEGDASLKRNLPDIRSSKDVPSDEKLIQLGDRTIKEMKTSGDIKTGNLEMVDGSICMCVEAPSPC